MWTVVYMAQNKEIAENVKGILESLGLLVKIDPINRKEKADDYYEVSVPEAEVEEAHGILIEKGY